MIGRSREQDMLAKCMESKRPEFIVVYGRRRVGKTFLVKEYFNERFAFYATGIPDSKTRGQLKAFNESLMTYGDEETAIPKDWFEAFRRLRKLLESGKVARDIPTGRRVVFLDEMPWMDTARSDFKSAFDYFWNSWGSSQKDLLLIACGSATSWIINNILSDNGGFYNRITGQIRLTPFSLGECEEYYKSNGIVMSRQSMIESYMIFGGIPYYLNLYDKRRSLAQNVDDLIIGQAGPLHDEYDRLFSSMFRSHENHVKMIEAIATKKRGLTRPQISEISGVSDGEGLTKALKELEQCDFIRKYRNYTTEKNGCIYQVTDPFVLFAYTFVKGIKTGSWQKFIKSPEYYAWRGNAFETVCLLHVYQIKAALGITGVDSEEYSWKSKKVKDGAQIDLLIDRRDDMINVCEMKCTDDDFAIDADYRNSLINKAQTFTTETNTKKAVHITLVVNGKVKRNEYLDTVQSVVEGDMLFERGSNR